MSSAFCIIRRIANIVSYLVIHSLSLSPPPFVSRQFIKFSNTKILYQVTHFAQIWISILISFAAYELGFGTDSVVRCVDEVRPSMSSSSLNPGHCHCCPCNVITGVLSHQCPFVCRTKTWRCSVKPSRFNFPYSALRAYIKIPSALIVLISTVVSLTMSVRLSLGVPHIKPSCLCTVHLSVGYPAFFYSHLSCRNLSWAT